MSLEDVTLGERSQAQKDTQLRSCFQEVPGAGNFTDRKQTGGCQGWGRGEEGVSAFQYGMMRRILEADARATM